MRHDTDWARRWRRRVYRAGDDCMRRQPKWPGVERRRIAWDGGCKASGHLDLYIRMRGILNLDRAIMNAHVGIDPAPIVSDPRLTLRVVHFKVCPAHRDDRVRRSNLIVKRAANS